MFDLRELSSMDIFLIFFLLCLGWIWRWQLMTKRLPNKVMWTGLEDMCCSSLVKLAMLTRLLTKYVEYLFASFLYLNIVECVSHVFNTWILMTIILLYHWVHVFKVLECFRWWILQNELSLMILHVFFINEIF